MKVLVDNDVIAEINDTQRDVIAHVLFHEELEDVLKYKLNYILNEEYNRAFKQLKEEWEPQLAASGVKMIPTDKDEFARLVFAQPGYKSRSQREQYVSHP